jgi:hypothetical protein
MELGLAEGEFWRLTPLQFHLYQKQHIEIEKRRYMSGYRFLATVVARIAGNEDANFMEDAADRPLLSLDTTESYFKALAEQSAKGR